VIEDCHIAVTGADIGFKINGRPAPVWTVHRVHRGDRIRFTGGPAGCRAYLCVRGGIDVPKEFGSRATDPFVRLGGLNGRPLQQGDEIPIPRISSEKISGRETDKLTRRFVNPKWIPDYDKEQVIRIILGPQDHLFTEKGVRTLLDSWYTVTPNSNNMGCHLEGPAIEHVNGADILSECIPEGSIQVPSSGKPIILLAGRRGIGGYAKIATVITVDIPKIAQMRPGNRLRFEAITLEQAHELLIEQERYFRSAEILSNELLKR
jgi:biotin-dependent carboxylase-like uncharacterized protein